MRIRKANAEDAAAAWEIRRGAILCHCQGHYPAEKLAKWTDGQFDEGFVRFVVEELYVAVEDGQVVATGMIDCGTGRVDAVFVRPDRMRQGVGRQMMELLEDLARDAGLAELSLDATLNAAPFYRRHGFVGETVSLYQSPRGFTLDCVPMKKSLRPPAEK
jgi:GNAT superfamily N-acetyltransferase